MSTYHTGWVTQSHTIKMHVKLYFWGKAALRARVYVQSGPIADIGAFLVSSTERERERERERDIQ